MSVVGIDLGALNTVIAVARNRGVDVVSIPFFSFLVPILLLVRKDVGMDMDAWSR